MPVRRRRCALPGQLVSPLASIRVVATTALAICIAGILALSLQQSTVSSLLPGFNTGITKGAMFLVAGIALAIIVKGAMGVPMYVALGLMALGVLFIALS